MLRLRVVLAQASGSGTSGLTPLLLTSPVTLAGPVPAPNSPQPQVTDPGNLCECGSQPWCPFLELGQPLSPPTAVRLS